MPIIAKQYSTAFKLESGTACLAYLSQVRLTKVVVTVTVADRLLAVLRKSSRLCHTVGGTQDEVVTDVVGAARGGGGQGPHLPNSIKSLHGYELLHWLLRCPHLGMHLHVETVRLCQPPQAGVKELQPCSCNPWFDGFL